MLLLSGDRDQFARAALLQEAVERQPSARLVIYPRIGQGIGLVPERALDEMAVFVPVRG